ncbi:MAG TPA: MFS transporter [Mycobacteriales bacterium]|nr:MFS transporter [Mycobacteriales bacterium]
MRLRTHAGFRLFWTASTVSGFGSQVTTLAIEILIVTTLAGSAADVGLVKSARWLPYLLVGIVVGALADRVRRKPLLVSTDLSRAVLLCAVPLLAWSGELTIGLLAALMSVFGLLSLVNDAAHQSFLPRLLPRESLTRANARLEQSSAAAETSGPAAAGGLVTWLGAPAAVLVDAGSYVVSGLLTARVVVTDPPPPTRGPLWQEIREGLAWVYGHRMLRPLSLITHGWTLFYAVLSAVYVPYGIRELHFSSLGLGLTLACGGVGGLLGSGLSERLGRRPGRVIPGAWLLDAAGIAVLAVTPAGGLLIAGVGQFLNGFGLGLSSPLELSYRQAITPDRLQARMNATMRSLNRTAVVIGAPLGGLLADSAGFRLALWVAAGGVALAAIGLLASPFRTARTEF